MASSTAADIPTTRGRRKQAKPQRKNVDLENLSSDDVVVTSVAASVGGAVAAGDCAPPAAAMSPDNNHNHQPLADQTPHQDEEQNSRVVSSPPEGESRRIFVGNDPGGAGLQGLLMVKVRKNADDRQGEVEVMGDDSEVMINGGTTVTDEVPQRRPMLRRGLLGEEEEKMLQECLQRSDTAVIFPEPVEQVPLPAASVGKAISPGSGADDVGGGAGGVGVAGIGPDYFIKCPQCHKGYPGFQALKDHVESSHPPPPHLGGDDGVSQPTSPVGSPAPNTPAGAAPGGIYACSQCSTSFLHKDQLEKHELLHSPNAQVSCKVCNKTFANVYRLQRHMISHDESAVLRKFKCPECEKAFKFKHHLKEHIRIHSGEKPFECANCGKRFSHSGSYSSHMTSKKCLVMNLKVGRGGRGGPNSLLDKCPPHHRGAGAASKRSLTNNSPLNSNASNATTNSSMNNSSFPPMLPKYGDAFLSAVTPRVPSRYHTSTSHPHPAAPNLHPFYMAVAPTMHLNPHPNSGINPYKLPASLSHLLEHLTASSPPHQPRICVAEGDRKMEEAVEEEKENEVDNDTQNQEKKDDAGSKDTKEAAEIKEERQVEGDIDMFAPEGEDVRQDEAGERESPLARSRSRNSPGAGSNSGDLEAVKRILETVNATVTKQFLVANMQKLSSTSSGSSCPSIASLSSPAANGTESNVTEFQKKNSEFSSTSEFLPCRHCQKKFPSPIDLHQHERYLCEYSVGYRRSEGLAAKLEDAVTVKTEEMSLNGGCSGSEDGDDADGRASGKEPVTEEDEYEAESITATDQISEDGRKVRVRSLIADEQLAVLKGHYSLNPRPKKDELSRIAEKIGFPVRVVQVWFQNTRARDRREGRLVHVPYVPLATVPGFPATSLVPSSQPSHLQTMTVGHYTTTSPPPCPSSGTEQPLDLSTKKTQHSLASTPSSSPLRPTSAAAHSDSGEDVGCAMNLSRKSSSSRSPTPNSNAVLTAPFRQLLPFQQPHYPHSSCSSSSIADFRQTPSPMSSINFQQHIEGLSNGIANSSRLARILAQPPVTASHRMVAGLTNGINGSTVGLVPMERLMYGADIHVSSRSPLPIFNHQHHLENGRACSSSPSSDKRSWKQGYLDGGDTTDEADDSGCGGGGNQETDHTLMMMDEDGSSPNKRHKMSPALNKGLLTNTSGVTGFDGEVEGQFICDQCDKAFSKQSSLARHKYEHSGQRPHKCDVCTKAFKHKHHLTEHKRLHSGEKPFQCSKCLKRFSHSGSYSQHMNHRYSYCKPYRE